MHKNKEYIYTQEDDMHNIFSRANDTFMRIVSRGDVFALVFWYTKKLNQKYFLFFFFNKSVDAKCIYIYTFFRLIFDIAKMQRWFKGGGGDIRKVDIAKEEERMRLVFWASLKHTEYREREGKRELWRGNWDWGGGGGETGVPAA